MEPIEEYLLKLKFTLGELKEESKKLNSKHNKILGVLFLGTFIILVSLSVHSHPNSLKQDFWELLGAFIGFLYVSFLITAFLGSFVLLNLDKKIYNLSSTISSINSQIEDVADARNILNEISEIESQIGYSNSSLLYSLQTTFEKVKSNDISTYDYLKIVRKQRESLNTNQEKTQVSHIKRSYSTARKSSSEIKAGSFKSNIENKTPEKEVRPEAFITNLSSIFSNEKNKGVNKDTFNSQTQQKGAEIVDYVEHQEKITELGLQGELFVLKLEKEKLTKLGRSELASYVEHTSMEKGNNLGYDIVSYNNQGERIFIEVKTTKQGLFSGFYLTDNEFSQLNSGGNYYIYRVYNFDNETNTGDIYLIDYSKKDIDQFFNLKPLVYFVNPIRKR